MILSQVCVPPTLMPSLQPSCLPRFQTPSERARQDKTRDQRARDKRPEQPQLHLIAMERRCHRCVLPCLDQPVASLWLPIADQGLKTKESHHQSMFCLPPDCKKHFLVQGLTSKHLPDVPCLIPWVAHRRSGFKKQKTCPPKHAFPCT